VTGGQGRRVARLLIGRTFPQHFAMVYEKHTATLAMSTHLA
jgi:hypothetical protein